MKPLKLLVFCLLVLFAIPTVHAQVNMQRIENLSDEQIVVFLKQNNLLGLQPAEIEKMARDKGLPTDQINALLKRIDRLDPMLLQVSGKSAELDRSDPYAQRLRIPTRTPKSKLKDSVLQVFGSELFSTDGLNFEGNLSIPTPSNYVLGVNDQLVIDVFGLSENTQKLKINTEGFVRIANLGPIKVAGLTIDQASAKIKSSLNKIYPAIASGKTQVSVALGQIRSIQVTLVGEVNLPGSFSLPSTATIMHAMYASGGPNEIGSYREIQLVRGGKTIVVFDLYDFLLNGNLTKNILLQDDDVVRVPSYSKRVAVKGAVKKQAIFDVKDPENAASVIGYAGGLADFAFKDLIRVKRLGNQSREIITLDVKDLSSFKLVSGDTLEVDTLSKKILNRISVSGAVYYPGEYGLSSFSTLRNLLLHVQPKENAFFDRAIVRRLKEDLSPSFLHFNINEVLSGKNEISLQKEDSIHIFEKEKIREDYFVTIEGEVNKPSFFTYAEGMRVQDLILMAKGLKDGAILQRIEVSRRLRQQFNGKDSSVYSVIKTIDIDPKDFELSSLDLPLQPYDIVYIRRAPSYKEQVNVMIEGEVMFPGKYTIQGVNERIAEVIKRAGGLKSTAFLKGAMLIRKTFQGSTSSDSTIFEIKYDLLSSKNKQVAVGVNKSAIDTALIAKETKEMFSSQKRVALDLTKALSFPGSSYDIVMQEGDILKIPMIQQTVQTFGEVNYPQQLVYENGMSFKQLINASGGFTNKASKRQSYLLEASGKVKSTSRFLFFNFYPSISPGSEVYVPMRKDRDPISKGEAIGITSALVSLAGIMLAIINSLK
jgi:protein involved in polysaccharide export with SLBB domain